MSRLMFSAQHLLPGRGGIAQVGRLSVKALSDRISFALAVEDTKTHALAGVPVHGFSGSRLRFVVRNAFEQLRSAHALYDYAGTGRANLGRSYALWVHGAEFWTSEQLRPDYRRVIQNADCLLTNSHFSARAMERALGHMPQASVCWLGTEHDDPPLPQTTEDPPTLLFVGRSDEFFAKGQDILIKVWPLVVSKVRDARLCFAGAGIRLPELRALAAGSSAASNIDVLGFQSEQEIEKLWRRATAFALLGNLEGFGLVVVEAMRHGIPVLTSNNDATCEINVDGVTGYNVDRADEAGIADRLIALLADRDHAQSLGMNGLGRWREHFSFSVFRARFRETIDPWLGTLE
ncbi:MAG: glycosyltransferase family 4 protein [Albidovulum sp.]